MRVGTASGDAGKLDDYSLAWGILLKHSHSICTMLDDKMLNMNTVLICSADALKFKYFAHFHFIINAFLLLLGR